jgi:hypothetical protein
MQEEGSHVRENVDVLWSHYALARRSYVFRNKAYPTAISNRRFARSVLILAPFLRFFAILCGYSINPKSYASSSFATRAVAD